MEREIKPIPGDNLDSVINRLSDAKARGEKIFIMFNGVKLCSDEVDSAYKKVTGYTKEEYDEIIQKDKEAFEQEQKEMEIREINYAKAVEESRAKGVTPITMESVVAGLKFIAENQDMSQEELVEGLLNLGCNYNLEETKKLTTDANESLFDAVKKGDLCAGASILINARDSELGRNFVSDKFLSTDDDWPSIYQFIRIATGDETYTKDNIELKNNSSGMHRS